MYRERERERERESKTGKCSECLSPLGSHKPTCSKKPQDKPTDNGKKPPNPDEICERCKTSCRFDEKRTGNVLNYTVKRRKITTYYTDFRKEVHWFGTNCPCAEQFKKENERNCSHCGKREWPDLNKNWVLDYEIHKAFCSSLCHVTYRQLDWEQAQRLTRVVLFPPQLEISNQGNQPNFNWEREGLRREVLYWREYSRSLEQKLSNQNNLTPQERQQANYLRNLQQNTLQNAENSYKNKYGSLVEDEPKNSDNKNKGLSGGIIVLLIIAGIALVGVVIFLLTSKKKKKSKI